MPTAFITGASGGIGEALARELARAGYHVVISARRLERLELIAEEIRNAGGSAVAVRVDVSRGDETTAAIRQIDEECGGLDLVVANAGVGADRALDPSMWEAVRDALQTNFVGAGATLTAVFPQMVERGRGHLVGIGSLASYGSVPGGLAYSAPKAGLSMMLDCLRLDSRGRVAVTEVKLGFVDTEAVAGASHALPQLMSAEEAARYLVRRLRRKPTLIVHPRTLGFFAWLGGKLPLPLRRLLFRLGGS